MCRVSTFRVGLGEICNFTAIFVCVAHRTDHSVASHVRDAAHYAMSRREILHVSTTTPIDTVIEHQPNVIFLKIQRIGHTNFGAKGSKPHETSPRDVQQAGMTIWVQLFRGPASLKFWRAKKRPKFGALSNNFRLYREYL